MSHEHARHAVLEADVAVTRGAFALEARVTVRPGTVLGVIGANGSGKSTMLGVLAGTVALDHGEVRLGERQLSASDHGNASVAVPRAARQVGLLDQRARLFAHMSARENIAFGPRAQGVPRARALEIADEWLDRIGLSHKAQARESQLSGGQQQRVAIARTLASDPDLLLLDEPFAALDVTSSAELRQLLGDEVRRLGVPALLVTHDPVDLIALADEVVVLEQGRVAQRGAVAEVLGAPATAFAAEFAGRTLLHGVASESGTLLVTGAPVPALHGSGVLPNPGQPAVASYDPSQVQIARVAGASEGSKGRGSADPRSEHDGGVQWVGTVIGVAASRTGVRVTCGEWPEFVADISVARALELALSPGDTLELHLPGGAMMFATPLG